MSKSKLLLRFLCLIPDILFAFLLGLIVDNFDLKLQYHLWIENYLSDLESSLSDINSKLKDINSKKSIEDK